MENQSPEAFCLNFITEKEEPEGLEKTPDICNISIDVAVILKVLHWLHFYAMELQLRRVVYDIHQ